MPHTGKCDPSALNINPATGLPLPSFPGILNFNIPGPEIPFPEGFPENLFDLFNKFKLRFPLGAALQGILDWLQKTVAQIVSNLLSQLAVFMAFYNFIIALLQMIICVIEVICAMPNPRKVAKKMRRLFRQCIPIFLSIFPFLALLALIMAILALLLALIAYIIMLIKRLIEELIKNIRNAVKAVRGQNTKAMLAIARKIAALMCIFENVMILLMAFAAFIELIQLIASSGLHAPCSDNYNPNSDLCGLDQCAEFLNNPDGMASSVENNIYGTMYYCNTLSNYDMGNPNGTPPIPPTITPVRQEGVYFTADSLTDSYQFKNIISSTVCGKPAGPFFPFGTTLTTETPTENIPYAVDLTIRSFVSGAGTRDISFSGTIVTNVTTSALIEDLSAPTVDEAGYLVLIGGTCTDSLGEFSGKSITDVFHQEPGYVIIPETAYVVTTNNVEFKVNIDHTALVSYELISYGCMPEIAQEQAITYSTMPSDTIDEIDLPDIAEAVDGLDACLNTFKSNVNEDTATAFGVCAENILNDLSEATENALCQTIQKTVDVYHTTAEVDPTMQFIKKPIQIIVTPKNYSGQALSDIAGESAISSNCGDSLASNFTATATFGEVSSFTYDGYGHCVATITSQTGGAGKVKVFYKGQQLGYVDKPTDIDEDSSIVSLEYDYTFVDAGAGELGEILEKAGIRRDEFDTARSK